MSEAVIPSPPVASRLPAPLRHPLRLWQRFPRLTLFVGFFTLYALTASYGDVNTDVESTIYPAWQLAHHGNVNMDGFADRTDLWFFRADGRLVSNRFPGTIWLAVPAYWLASPSGPSLLPGALVAAAVTSAALVVLFSLLRIIVSRSTAAAAVAVAGLATPVWTVSADSLWTHGPGQFLLLLAVLLLVRQKPLWAGAAFGAAVLVRPHYAVVPAVLMLVQLRRERDVKSFLSVLPGGVAGVLLLVTYNLDVFGALLPRSYEYGAVSPSVDGVLVLSERLAGTLLSQYRGIFFLSPFLLLLLRGLPPAWRSAPGWVTASASAGTAYMLLQLILNRWSGGSGFYSYRLALEWLTLCAPLITLAYREAYSGRRGLSAPFAALLGLSFATHAVGAVFFRVGTSVAEPWLHWSLMDLLLDDPAVATFFFLAFACATAGWLLMRLSSPPVTDSDGVVMPDALGLGQGAPARASFQSAQ